VKKLRTHLAHETVEEAEEPERLVA